MYDAKYAKTEVWRRHGGQQGARFCVEVKHWLTPRPGWEPGLHDGPHRWNVYAIVFKGHRLFDGLSTATEDNYMSSEEVGALPLHGGATYCLPYHDSTGAVTSIEIGCDYAHLHDYFDGFATPEEARRVFADADELFCFLEGRDHG